MVKAQAPSVALLAKGSEPLVDAEVLEEVAIDIDALSDVELDALVKENELEVPNEFWVWDLDAKKAFLNERFNDESPASPAAKTADKAEAKANVAAAKKAESDAKKAAAKADKDAAAAAKKSAMAALKDKSLDGASNAKLQPMVDAVKMANAAKSAMANAEPAKSEPGSATVKVDPDAIVPSDPAATTAAPKGKKAKATALVEVKEGVVEAKDSFSDLVAELENLKEPQARSLVSELMDSSSINFFKIGGALCRLQAQGWHKPFSTFNEFVEQQYGLKARRAGYYMQIYNALANGKIEFEKVKAVGWTKLAIIARVITPDNIEEWVKIALGQNALTLTETVKDAVDSKKLSAPSEDDGGKVKAITFKPHKDQLVTIESALEKAKEASGTEHGTVALEFICLDYLGTQTLASKLKTLGIEKSAELFAEAFPEWDLTVEPASSVDKAA